MPHQQQNYVYDNPIGFHQEKGQQFYYLPQTPTELMQIYSIPSGETYCCLLVRYLLNHFKGSPLIPDLSSSSRRILWFTVSHALARSKKTPQVNTLLSIAFVRLSVTSPIACSVERPFLNPNWKWHTMSYFSI